MKGFIIAALIFISLTSALLFYNFYINFTFNSYSEELEIIEDSIALEKYNKAKSLTESFEQKLKKDAEILHIITDRTPIDNALAECSRLICFIETKDKAEAKASASGIKVILENTKEKSALNIFQ